MRTILFVDDHPIFREGLRRTLEAEIGDLAVLLVASAQAALSILAAGANVDLLLADQKLPDVDGIALLASVRKAYPTIGVGLLCGELSFALIARARALGAVLCMSKGRGTNDLASAIRTVFEGGQVFDDMIPARPGGAVSPRRREILTLASEGLSDKAIGERLGVSENTVRNHWKYIFEQLNVGSRTEAVGKAIRQGTI